MKLYYMPGACPLATHTILEWIGKPYELQLVSRTEMKEPAYLALNPTGAVPTLQDGDLTLTQTASIVEYLAELNPEAGLVGDTVRERAETRRWLGFINSDMHRTFGLLFAAPAFVSSEAAQAELCANATKKLVSYFGIVNKQLEGKTWLTGKRSVADPYLYTLLRWAQAKSIDLSALPNLGTYFKHMNADAGVAAAVKAQGLS